MSYWGKCHLSSKLFLSEDTANAHYACTQKAPELFPENLWVVKALDDCVPIFFFQAFFGFIFLLTDEVAFLTRCIIFKGTSAHVLSVKHPI